ncbi:OLC1v1024498C1 [Oldenlandia corymbosa var. corymbosa]|uniref:OLC1v1024498C1 n=1 Tax=Oldenlandia corymbosa var. corymbosa TaxID=529605 RepID=A0AAV1C2V6_OLDCO|nr:OLC1v1024498C1 [Oldenlandia corymbosa var. corymbosa]
MTKRQEFVLQKREMSYPATENNILVFTQTLQEEMSMGDDGIHKIMPITTDLVCLQTRSQIKFLNPKTTQLASIEWPYDVPLSNCETAFGFVYWRVDKLSSEIATPQELMVVFDYHTQQFQTINCPPSPIFFNPTDPSHMNLHVKILDFQGTLCVIDEYHIT